MEHFIKNIEITNFKSIRHAEIKDCRRVNVFVGYPNVGKSNILEALGTFSFIQAGSTLPINAVLNIELFAEIFFYGNTNDAVKIVFDNVKSLTITNSELNELKFSCAELDRNDKIFHEIYSSSLKESVNESTGETEQFLKEVFSPSVKIYKYNGRAINGEKTNSHSLSVPSGQNLFDVLNLHKDIKSEIFDLFKRYDLSLISDRTSKKLKIMKKISETEVFILPYNQIAETLKRLIFYKTAILSNKKSVLLFEEPESHMFPPFMGKLSGDIIYDENENQFFISTHSPFILNDLMEDVEANELSIYAVGLQNGETTITRMTDEQVTEAYQYGVDLFFNLENYLSDETLVTQ